MGTYAVLLFCCSCLGRDDEDGVQWKRWVWTRGGITSAGDDGEAGEADRVRK
jgi:hypothetical protein